MTAVVLAGLLLVANLFFQKNRFLTILLLGCLWVLFVFSSGLPDEQNYINHFENEYYASDKGPGYAVLVSLLNQIGFGYIGFKVLVGTFYLLAIGVGAFRCSRRPGLIVALAGIFPFCMDAVQLRYTLAFAIVLVGFFVLYSSRGNRRGRIAYVVACFFGGAFHVGVLPFLFLLIPCYFQYRQIFTIALIVFIASFLAVFCGGIEIAAEFLGGGQRYSGREMAFDLAGMTRMVLPALCWILFPIVLNDGATKSICLEKKWLVGFNVMLIAIWPLLLYAPDLFRLEASQFVIAYFLVGNMMNSKRGVVLETLVLVVLAFVELGLVVLFGQNFFSVWVPLLFNNSLLS